MYFSLITPCYNEASNLPAFFNAATSCFDKADIDYEIVFVNDGSTDGTMQVLKSLVEDYRGKGGQATVVLVELSRNFGKEAALYAGLEKASGDFVGFIDADMQQDPEISLEMLTFLKDHEEYDSVAAVQENRKESAPMRLFKRMFYSIFNHMGEMQIVANSSDFGVFSRQVAEALLSVGERYRFSKGLFAWVGFRTYTLTYSANPRLSGKSKWTFRKLFSYGWNGVLAFSTWPLRVIMYGGLIVAVLTLVFFGIDFYHQMVHRSTIPGYQMVLYVVLLVSGVQMFVLGIFGEYMARAYIESKQRPIYIERRTIVSKPENEAE